MYVGVCADGGHSVWFYKKTKARKSKINEDEDN